MTTAYPPSATRRHRHPVAGALLAVLLVAAWLLAAGVIGGHGPGAPTPTGSGPGAVQDAGLLEVAATSYVVQPGDTLWSVARGLQPQGDVRPLVDELARRTAGVQLRAGQRIRLP